MKYISRIHLCTHIAMALLLMTTMAGCGLKRQAVPVELQHEAVMPDFDEIRFYGDTVFKAPEEMAEDWKKGAALYANDEPLIFLSLSGGGADGAFGAGFLSGWSARGDRPEFRVVSGVSTGALIAPFAFLGPEYDNLVEMFYTTFDTDKIAKMRPIGSALAGDSLMTTEPLRHQLKTFVTAEVIRKIAKAHRKGRRLFIGTTNLDEMRPVYWDIGEIAQYDNPKAHQLIRDVILASASVPVAFPPVYFHVEADGVTYDEMHVDGGVTNQVFAYPVSVRLGEVMEKMGDTRKVKLYIIRNDALVSSGIQVEPTLNAIATRSLAGLIRNQGIGDLYRMYATAQRDGVDYNLAFIPPSFNEESDEMFDPTYMKKLYRVGFKMAMGDNPWHKCPPEDLAPHH
ncbi:patatin-like phospholipase family protein [Pseudodesulfovibrio sp. zrk46]|uniref:patatin-like phospholipase family protein n=1 Tax=Pseudodesulfovibrio sp. zrk46 TaxID=2725288 RepID=UPI00144A1F8F|nr:patatin-like phospholipase family protein [Pseudodesulfovibrio sp. zrk46]QJB56148.1 hypothetical protein HFN16_06860 [Pseudodesulfovibrio sp. zrk46]